MLTKMAWHSIFSEQNLLSLYILHKLWFKALDLVTLAVHGVI